MLTSYRNWSRYTVNFLGGFAAEDRGRKVTTIGVKFKVMTTTIEKKYMNIRKNFNITAQIWNKTGNVKGSVIQVGSLVM